MAEHLIDSIRAEKDIDKEKLEYMNEVDAMIKEMRVLYESALTAKSQNKEDSEDLDLPSKEEAGFVTEEIDDEIIEDDKDDSSEMDEMLKKKEETDAWIVKKAKNGSKTNEKLSLEIAELNERVKKLETIIEKINEALR